MRAFNLDTGEDKSYEGHESWVNCMATYEIKDENGNVTTTWLLTGSDDSSIRIWDMKTCMCIEELKGHRNGVTSIVVCNNKLYTSSFDHYIMEYDYF